MNWGRFEVRDIEYCLAHLSPIYLIVPTSAPTPGVDRRVLINFGCHTFTRELQDTDPSDLRFVDGKHVRCFCPSRYLLSTYLPDLIRQAVRGKARFNKKQSPFLLVNNVPYAAGPYLVYFQARKAERGRNVDVVIDVRSAHYKPNFVDNLQKIGFSTIVGLTAAGKPIVQPKK